MRRRLNLLWVPLLAALLAGSPAQRLPAGATETAVRRLEGSALALALPRAAVRLQPAPDPRSSAGRHGTHTSALLAGVEPTATGAPLRILAAQGNRDLVPESSRHFPLFPTGPPQHS